MPEALSLRPGDPRSLGRYELVGRLGAGGQGAVFLGRTATGERVAVKLLHDGIDGDPAARTRFAREAEAARRIAPFCTARILEFDAAADPPYIVSEYIDGQSLFDAVRRHGTFGGEPLNRLAIGTATALAAIHEAGIIHRDFKPNNVMLAADGPRVVDFGVARSIDAQQSALTATGAVVGTPAYLAPEQFTGDPITPAVDVFAWGVTIMFAATGSSPFQADTLAAVMHRVLTVQPDLTPIAGPLRELVGAALVKQPGHRPAAAQLLLRLLGDAAPATTPDRRSLLMQGTRFATVPGTLPQPPSPARPWTQPPPPQAAAPAAQPPWHQTQPASPARSRRAPLIIALAGVVALAAIGVFVWARSGGSTKSPAIASGFTGTWMGNGVNTGSDPNPAHFTVQVTLRSVPIGSNPQSTPVGRFSFGQTGGTCSGTLTASTGSNVNDTNAVLTPHGQFSYIGGPTHVLDQYDEVKSICVAGADLGFTLLNSTRVRMDVGGTATGVGIGKTDTGDLTKQG